MTGNHPLVRATLVAASTLSGMTAAIAATQSERIVPTIEWQTVIGKFQIDKDKFVGQRLTVVCPEHTIRDKAASISGTDVYTMDSPICPAAIHTGAIGKEGGEVTVQINPSPEQFDAMEKNGIVSHARPQTKRSFVFTGFAEGDDSADAVRAAWLPRIDWRTKFTRSGFASRHLTGQRFMFVCPKMPAGHRAQVVYGTDEYAFDSPVCQGAIHAGAITEAGGVVEVQINDSRAEHVSSIRNGVESRSKPNSVGRSLTFIRSE